MENCNNITQLLSDKYLHLPQEAVDQLFDHVKCKKLKRGELWLSEGEMVTDIAFVYSGLLREYYYKNSREITERFATEGGRSTSYFNLFTKSASFKFIEALEPTVLVIVPYDLLVEYSYKSAAYYNLLKEIYESSLAEYQIKSYLLHFESSRERYEVFLKVCPQIAYRVPSNYIATFLLMTPETLSRVRAEICR